MNIKPITPAINNYNPSFKSYINIDNGGSQREGSFKIRYATSEDDQVIFLHRGTLNPKGIKQFKDSNDFKDKIADKIKIVQNNNRNNVEEMGYDKSENAIKSLTIFVPTYTSGTYGYYLPNHKNLEDRPIKDIDFSDMKERLVKKGVEIAPDMEFKILQDAMGTGLTTAKRLYDNGMLTKGKYYTACITGGGCAIADIEMTDDNYVVIKSAGSRQLSEPDEIKKVSKAGASAPTIIVNFCKTFGLNEEMIEDIKNCGKSEFVLKEQVTFDKDVKTEKLKKLLLDTGKYEIEDENKKEFTIKVKDKYKEQFDRSRHNAIDQYCWAFARLASVKKSNCSNGLIVTGPIAKAIDKVAKEQYGYKNGISEWITQHLLSKYNCYETDKMQEQYHFEVFCDDRFALDDNTACNRLAGACEFIEPKRGNWIKINIKDLQTKDSNE